MSRHDYTRGRQAGLTRAFTLIEIMVSTSILATVFVFVAMVMQSASTQLEVNVPDSALQGEMQQAIQRIVNELEEASESQLTVAADGSWISFRVPVDVDNWSPGPLSFGARRGRMQESANGLNWIVFEPGSDRRTGNPLSVDEATVVTDGLNVNINTEEDKDTDDVFVVGHLLTVYDPNGTYDPGNPDPTMERPLTGDWVAQVAKGNEFGGDVDGAGVDTTGDGTHDYYDDLIFRVDDTGTSKRVVVNLWGLRVIQAQKVPILMNRRASVVLTNP